MKLQTNLVLRGTKYYYRGRVPQDLRNHFNKTEILISLRTSDRQQANLALSQVKVELLSSFAELRGQKLSSDKLNVNVNILPNCKQPTSSLAYEQTVALDTIIKHWAAQSTTRPRTLMEVETAKKRLINVAGHDNARNITKADGIALRESLLAQKLSVATIQKQINLLRAVFESALNDDLISNNPFRAIKLTKPKVIQKSRVPFTTEDLNLIFSSPIYIEGYRTPGGAGEAAFWLPLIALWSGMRLEEIGQLLVTDIGNETGIYFFQVFANPAMDITLKTTTSNRRIPIHNKLIEHGLIEYVNRMKDAGSLRLFPLLKSAGDRQLTASWSQWFSRYLRKEIGITDSRKTFHSFRHGFKEACRLYGIPKDIHDELTGHSSSDVGDGYGGDLYPLKPLSRAINMLNFNFMF